MFDLTVLIKSIGYLGIFAIIFSESGLLIGLFFPGDSLLFTAGFLAAQGFFNIYFLVGICILGAILGDNFGYRFGYKIGPKIFVKDDSLFFHKGHLERARLFYEKYGGKTIILARFVPFVRTFAPILAGVGRMNYATFFIYNIIGSIIWGLGITLVGYFLGGLVENIDTYLLPLVGVIVLISMAPIIIEIIKYKKSKL